LIPILLVLLILVTAAMIGLILIQRGKGGGLVGLGGGGMEQAFGTHAASLAQKATGVLAVLFVLLSAMLGKLMLPRGRTVVETRRPPAQTAPGPAQPEAGEGMPSEPAGAETAPAQPAAETPPETMPPEPAEMPEEGTE
jgi:preprotein translocase subunit SecG